MKSLMHAGSNFLLCSKMISSKKFLMGANLSTDSSTLSIEGKYSRNEGKIQARFGFGAMADIMSPTMTKTCLSSGSEYSNLCPAIILQRTFSIGMLSKF